ncbi:hypothetical protein BDF22DRAFT_698680 [Syncephalis plumigaleata]|nr:hypothetical protein BDF22DRAFT_698680 [Syncephalis plumigaleata]
MDNRPLPPGWISQFDQGSNRYFYVETATGKSVWEDPRPAFYANQPPTGGHSATPVGNMPSDMPMSMPSADGGAAPPAYPAGPSNPSMPSDKSHYPPAGTPLQGGPPPMPGYGASVMPGGYGTPPGYSTQPPLQPGYGAPPGQQAGYGMPPPGQPGYGAAAPQANAYYGGAPPPPGQGDAEKLGMGKLAGLAAGAGGVGLLGSMLANSGKPHGSSSGGGGFMSSMLGGSSHKPPKPQKPHGSGSPMVMGAAAALGGGALGYAAAHVMGGGKKHKHKKHKGWKGFKGKGWKGFKAKGWKGFKGWK